MDRATAGCPVDEDACAGRAGEHSGCIGGWNDGCNAIGIRRLADKRDAVNLQQVQLDIRSLAVAESQH